MSRRISDLERRRKDELALACSSGISEMLRKIPNAFGANPTIHNGTHSIMVRCEDGELYHIKVLRSG